MLLEEFLKPMELSQRDLADAIDVPYQRINEIVNGRRGITPSTAVRLGHFFDMSSGFWLNLQTRWDLYNAERAEAAALRKISKYRTSKKASSRN
jgi:addiction module HigA family antidote